MDLQKEIKVLIIDDEEHIGQIIGLSLKRIDVPADFTTDPVKGFELIKSGNYQIIMLDLLMPKESGLVLLGKIKKFNPKIQVIIVTAYSSDFSMNSCIKSGADDFLAKPFTVNDLNTAVQNCITKLKRWVEVENKFALNKKE